MIISSRDDITLCIKLYIGFSQRRLSDCRHQLICDCFLLILVLEVGEGGHVVSTTHVLLHGELGRHLLLDLAKARHRPVAAICVHHGCGSIEEHHCAVDGKRELRAIVYRGESKHEQDEIPTRVILGGYTLHHDGGALLCGALARRGGVGIDDSVGAFRELRLDGLESRQGK